MAFWSSNGHMRPELWQMQMQERPAASQDESIVGARRQDNFVPDEQSPIGTYNNEFGQPFNEPFDAQSAAFNNASYNALDNAFGNANYAHYANGGAFPLSASSHANVPPAAPTLAQSYTTFFNTIATTSDASRPTINPSSNASTAAASGLGALPTSSVSNVPSPSPSLQSQVNTGDIQQNTAPPARKPLPSQRQTFVTSKGPSSHGVAAQRTATAKAKARPIPSSSSAVPKKSNSTPHSQDARSGNIVRPKPAQLPALASKPVEGSGGTGMNKPILKMRRTGQNSPLSPVGTSSPLRTPASLHQRNGSNSPGGRAAPGFSNTGIRKAGDPVPGKSAGASLPATSPVSRSPDTGVGPAAPSKAPTSTFCFPCIALNSLLTWKHSKS